MKHMDINNFNNWAKNHIFDDNRFDSNGFIIMENHINYKSTVIIAKIFEDHWNDYYNKYKNTIDSIRPNANLEVKKVINYSNHNLGTSVFFVQMIMKLFFLIILVKVNFVLLVVLNLKKLKLKTFYKNALMLSIDI